MHIKAQSGNERVRTITVANDTLTIDTLSIIPGTMTISYVESGDTLFTILDK